MKRPNLREHRIGVTSDAFRLQYEPALDGLRGISILAVMAFNAAVVFKRDLLLMKGGFLGVDIFFVLSGFLITALLVQGYSQTSGLGLRNFYFRRALRLLPALVALMLAIIAYALLFQTADTATSTLTGVLYTLIYLANWVQIPPGFPGIGPMAHAWSLSVEEQFYIVWPIILLCLLKVKREIVVFVILIAMIMISVIWSIWLWHDGAHYLRTYLGSDTRAHELLIGCAAALLVLWGVVRPVRRLKWPFHIVSLLSLTGILLSFFTVNLETAFVYNGGFALISIGTAIVIMDFLLFPSRFSQFFEFGPLVWIGKISYGLYLWHFPVFLIVRRFGGSLLNVIIGVVVTFVVATASYYLLERPFLRLKRRFGSPGSKPATHDPKSLATASA